MIDCGSEKIISSVSKKARGLGRVYLYMQKGVCHGEAMKLDPFIKIAQVNL